MDMNTLHWQEPASWEDCEPRLWLRDNLMSYDEMYEFVRETEEYRQTWQKVDEAFNSEFFYGNARKIGHAGTFADWLWHIGGCYIGNFDAQDVLADAIREDVEGYGHVVEEVDGWTNIYAKD